jgi:hypothetical protein
MIVYCNCGFSEDLRPQNTYCVHLVAGLLHYFQDLEFGSAVEEIAHYCVCGHNSYLKSYGLGTAYSTKTRSISNVFQLEYEPIKSLEGEQLLTFFKERMLRETETFKQKRIRNFDFDKYMESLNNYFNKATRMMLQGRIPGEGEVLNDYIRFAMAKKLRNL